MYLDFIRRGKSIVKKVMSLSGDEDDDDDDDYESEDSTGNIFLNMNNYFEYF